MLLYFTNQTRMNRTQAQELLPGRFDNGFASREVTAGPGGASGVVFCRSDRFCRFDSSSQAWQSLGLFPAKQPEVKLHQPDMELAEDPNANMVEVWVGWDQSNPPTPTSLVRPKTLPGHFVELAGSQWMIPLVREYSYQNQSIVYDIVLPKAAKYDSASKLWHAGEVVDRHRRLFDLAQEVFECYTKKDDDDEEQKGFTLPPNSIDLCAELLSANYYLGPEEISVLGLVEFDFRSAWSILRLVIDEPGMQEMLQKKMACEGN